MARSPSLLLRKEDYPDITDAETWDRLLRALNGYHTQVTAAFTRGLTVRENLTAQWKELSFTTDAASKVSALRFDLDLPGGAKAAGVSVQAAVSIDAATKGETPVALYGPAWTAAADAARGVSQVTVVDFGGLAASTRYRTLLLVLGG